MLENFTEVFDWLEREITIISRVLYLFVLLHIYKVISLIYNQRYEQMWSLLGSLTSVFAAILITRVYSRQITNDQIIREDERRIDVVRITHYLIAITSDLRSKVGYFKKTLREGVQSPSILENLSQSIEKRYEALLEKELYKFLPSESVNLINDMSGTIFGINAFSNKLVLLASESQTTSINKIIQHNPEKIISNLTNLEKRLDTLINQIYVIREKVNTVHNNNKN